MLLEARRLLREAYNAWWADRAMSLGAAISFYTVFSLAPMLLTAIAVAALAFGREAAQGAVVRELGGLMGVEAASAVEAMIVSASNVGAGAMGTAVGIASFLFLATGAVVELQDDLNLIWKVKGRETYGVVDFVRARLLSLVFLVGLGFLLLVSLLVDAGLSALSGYLEALYAGLSTALRLLNSAVAFGVAVLLFALIFKVLPDVDLQWRDVWTGAFVTGLLFTVGKVLIGEYIGRSGIASSYGAAASVITLLLWIYYSSLILLFGAEFTKVYAESRGSLTGTHRPAVDRAR